MILKFPDFWRFSNFPDNFTEFPDFSLTLKKNWISLTGGHPVNRDGSSWVEPVLSQDKCVLLKDHGAVTSVRLEPSVKHSTTEPLRSQKTVSCQDS